MAPPPQPRAAGAFVALAVLAGTALGLYAGQSSLGIVGGAALGIVVALILWRRDRRRG